MEQGECNPAKAGIQLNHRDQFTPELSVPAAGVTTSLWSHSPAVFMFRNFQETQL